MTQNTPSASDFGGFRFGAMMMGVAAVLHLLLVPFAGLSELTLVGLALVAGAILWTGWRGPGWLVMLALIVATGVELSRLGGGVVHDLLIGGVVLADLGAILSVFVALWKGRAAPT